MNLARTGHAPQSGTSAEAQALIAEARARARRRRQRIALAVVGAAVLAVGTLAATGGLSGSRPEAVARKGPANAVTRPASPPRYFLNAPESGSAYGWLEIRDSATGKLVAQPRFPDALQGYDPPYGLAATGPDSFVVGMMTPSDCSTRFFHLQVNNQGRPGALTPFGPTLPGELTALAASAGGGLIGYAIDDSGCNQGAASPGAYLGVLDVRSGKTRQWTQGMRISQLSMSANGRLLAYTQTTGSSLPGGGETLTGLQVRVLPADAPPGTVAERSRVVAREPATFASAGATNTVLLSPSGTSFYLCSQPFNLQPGVRQQEETARIVTFQTATGKATGTIADFSLSYIPPRDLSYYAPTVGCSAMALDPSGRFLLVPYREVPLNMTADNSGAVASTAVINTVTGARSTWTLKFGADTMAGFTNIAW